MQFFTPGQSELVDRLADMIIPVDERSPGAHEAKASLFIDLMAAGSGQDIQNAWREGLAAVDAEARRRFQAPFLKGAAARQDAILAAIAVSELHPETAAQRFFVLIEAMTVDGYYTSAVGIHRELCYKRNTPMHAFTGCAHPEHGSARHSTSLAMTPPSTTMLAPVM